MNTNLIGYSSGAIAKGDVGRGVEEIASLELAAAELSALRRDELRPLVEALPRLRLDRFAYLSLHAPGRIEPDAEADVLAQLRDVVADRPNWPLIVHPDAIRTYSHWRGLGENLCVENMDKRKPVGRTAEELEEVFRRLPDATLCFDVGHAWQVDRTMGEAHRILRRFSGRIRQVHVSEVTTASAHVGLTIATITAFRKIFDRIVELDVPLIIESVVPTAQLAAEVRAVQEMINRSHRPLAIPD